MMDQVTQHDGEHAYHFCTQWPGGHGDRLKLGTHGRSAPINTTLHLETEPGRRQWQQWLGGARG